MAEFKKKTRKRFAKRVRKLVAKYGPKEVRSVVTSVIKATDPQKADTTTSSAKGTKKRKSTTEHTNASTA